MISSPLYRELCLQLHDDSHVADAVGILNGSVTLSEVADRRGQEMYSFDGDADVLTLSYTDIVQSRSKQDAAKVLGEKGNLALIKHILPALSMSKVQLEINFCYCNLSTDTIIALADSIRFNSHIVGFSVIGDIDDDEIGAIALKYACIKTKAPLEWFQGEMLSEQLISAREALRRQRETLREGKRPTLSSTDSNENGNIDVGSCDDDEVRTETPYKILYLESETLCEPQEQTPEDDTNGTRYFTDPKRIVNERELWLVKMKAKFKRSKYSDDEIDNIIVNLELNELQRKIDSLLFDEESAPSTSTAVLQVF